MRNEGLDFGTLLKEHAEMESAAKGIHNAMTDLALEIVQKPAEIQTDAEKAYVKAHLHLLILSLMHKK